jgi:hypothetical protein
MKAGLKPHEIEDMHWRDFSLFVHAYELRERSEWERTRLLAYMQYLTTGEKTKKSIERFMPFPWDKKEDRGAPLTEQELQNALKLFS